MTGAFARLRQTEEAAGQGLWGEEGEEVAVELAEKGRGAWRSNNKCNTR